MAEISLNTAVIPNQKTDRLFEMLLWNFSGTKNRLRMLLSTMLLHLQLLEDFSMAMSCPMQLDENSNLTVLASTIMMANTMLAARLLLDFQGIQSIRITMYLLEKTNCCSEKYSEINI